MSYEFIFHTLKAQYTLAAASHSFFRACESSIFFREHLDSWVDESRLDEFKRQALNAWLPHFMDPLEMDWLDAQLDVIFTMPVQLEDDIESLIMNRLRFVRNIFQVRSIYREAYAVGRADQLLVDQMREYSLFADRVFAKSERFLRASLCAQWGLETVPPAMVIFALGKLGAHELNLSSDVDLIFSYEHTITFEDLKERTSGEFYTRLAQRLIRFLSDRTPEGIVFRVDMRLRPFGQSGALVWSNQALESYYVKQGRMWERYAWIKARALTGGQYAAQVSENMALFVYRRYVDFSVIDSLREMKALIEREVNRKESFDNIKIGMGGIREVEFIIQVIQLVRGGEFTELRQSSLMEAMNAIESLSLLPDAVIHELRSHYIYLRRVEHFLQAYQDSQTQCLPRTEEGWDALVTALGEDTQDAVSEKIQLIRTQVHQHFQETIRPQRSSQIEKGDAAEWAAYWPDNLESMPQEKFRSILVEFRETRCVSKASDIACQRLNELMPLALAMLEKVTLEKSLANEATLSHQLHVNLPELEICWVEPEEILQRFLTIVESILRRSVYISLLTENPKALQRVLQMCGMTTLVPDKLARYPSLLDEFVDDTPVQGPPSKEMLIDELRQQLMRIPEDDFEQQMNRLRAFKQRHSLRAAMADIAGQLSLMNVSDYLTWLAEALLQAALEIAWRKLVLKYGEPKRFHNEGTGFLIVGYGKLGGIEMSYTSDLDIVFLYDAPVNGETDGSRIIENSVFYMQLVKNLNHILMTDTLDGRLYEIDMRLRPSGSAGLFVSTFEGFQRYQQQEAWVWERQALVRARPVAGDAHLFSRFNAIRHVSLFSIEKNAALRQSVLTMRQKIKAHFLPSKEAFDLKYSPGGLVDIEFLAQHLVLSCAEFRPAIARYPDNVRIFELAYEENILTQKDSRILIQAYLVYRALIHRLSLQKRSLEINPEGIAELRSQVIDVFSRWFSLKCQ